MRRKKAPQESYQDGFAGGLRMKASQAGVGTLAFRTLA